MQRRNGWLGALALVVVTLGVAGNPAHAQVVPFRATGSGVADWLPLPVEFGGRGPAFHFADGTATMLGRYHAEGVVQMDEFTGPLTATFSSTVPVVFTGANGDKLSLHYEGTVELIPVDETHFVGVWDAEFTPAAGSTGRFANVIDGSVRFIAITDPFELDELDVGYSWTGEGTLTFGRPRR